MAKYQYHRLIASPSSSSLHLQKLLYFGAVYAPAFGAAHVGLCAYKLTALSMSAPTRGGLLPALVVLWAVVEAARLRLGYVGNLRERAPELSAFVLLTAAPAVPIVVYLSFVQAALGDALPLDLAVGVPLLILYALQLHAAVAAVRLFVDLQRVAFLREVAASAAGGAAPVSASRVVTARPWALSADAGTPPGGAPAAATGAGGTAAPAPAPASLSLWATAEAGLRHLMTDAGGLFGAVAEAAGAAGAPSPSAAGAAAVGGAPAPRTLIARPRRPSADSADGPPRAGAVETFSLRPVPPPPPAASGGGAPPSRSLWEAAQEGLRHVTEDGGGLFGGVSGAGAESVPGPLTPPLALATVPGAGNGNAAAAEPGAASPSPGSQFRTLVARPRGSERDDDDDDGPRGPRGPRRPGGHYDKAQLPPGAAPLAGAARSAGGPSAGGPAAAPRAPPPASRGGVAGVWAAAKRAANDVFHTRGGGLFGAVAAPDAATAHASPALGPTATATAAVASVADSPDAARGDSAGADGFAPAAETADGVAAADAASAAASSPAGHDGDGHDTT